MREEAAVNSERAEIAEGLITDETDLSEDLYRIIMLPTSIRDTRRTERAMSPILSRLVQHNLDQQSEAFPLHRYTLPKHSSCFRQVQIYHVAKLQ